MCFQPSKLEIVVGNRLDSNDRRPRVTVRLDHGETDNVEISGGYCMSPILFNFYSEWLSKKP